MLTPGDSEAEFLREIADAVAGTTLGLISIGMNEDRTFSIVVQEPDGIVIAFTGPFASKVGERFRVFCAKRKQ